MIYWTKNKEPTILFGWDMDRFVSREKDEPVERGVSWKDIEKIEEWLWPEERIILLLMRQGKTPSDIAAILDLKSRQLGRKEMVRAMNVAQFFLKWKDIIEEFPGSKLHAREKQFLNLFVVKRLHWRDIAFKLGVGKYAARRRLQILLEKMPGMGFHKYAELLKDAWAHRGLREARFDDVGKKIDESNKRRASQMEPWRLHLKENLINRIGNVLYVWGGQDWDGGKVDCSGLVIEALKEVNKLPENFRDMTADGLMRYFPTTKKPKLCDLVFYGSKKKAKHIMFYLGKNQVKGFEDVPVVIGMCNGRRGMTYAQAEKVGAGLWLRRSAQYRSDFIKCCRVE